ncbi:PH domain-containing protein [Colwellia chukchiensis]|uniref:PH domain-containing protein n=1 Tax=Colwellia chukchiensis TaxID=641665 RepID=A0A1H7U033_9GAMM|nr:PH domain-containing protein [Colwellia chukchiensis]SEL90149.1 PH domain-containing protein [Colwellia chukchiensis]
MKYIEQSLSQNEVIHDEFKLHWFSRIPLVILIILVLPSIGISLPFAIYEYLRLRSIEQGVTNKRVILKTGIISRKTEEMKIDAVETIEIDQSILGRIFGFADVKLTGRGMGALIFKSIDEPIEVKKAIEEVL